MGPAELPEVNPYAPPEVEPGGGASPLMPFEGFLGYAGFWRRLLAFAVDYFACVAAMLLCSSAIEVALIPMRFAAAPAEIRALTTLAVFFLFTVALPVTYFAAFESSRYRATLGKQLLGIMVTDLNGHRIGFLHALFRLFAKFFSALILYVGFLMAGFTSRKQALHDMIAGTLVVRSR